MVSQENNIKVILIDYYESVFQLTLVLRSKTNYITMMFKIEIKDI